VITHLDEALTMSARMSAATGDPKWEERYLAFEPQLDAAIGEAQHLAPDVYAEGAARLTDYANQLLVQMEHGAFDLVRSGRLDEAAAILSGEYYEGQKRVYAQGNADVEAALRENGDAAVASADRQWLISVAVVAAPLLLGIWLAVLLSTNRHIVARRKAEEALRDQARRDPLTGALNHGAIMEEVQRLASEEQNAPCAVAMVDVDGLKRTNDLYGHLVGDAALVAIAQVLASDGAIVGRYGGDEFVVLLPGADRPAAERYCADTKERLAHTNQIDAVTGAAVPLAASIGVAIYPDQGRLAAQLIKVADDAMYAQRRNRPVSPRPAVVT
jgi:diguanylate cyclase (GGDEF)-like protein